MLTDNQIKQKGLEALVEELGDVDAEKFIALLLKEPFDYTKWQQSLWTNLSIHQLSRKAMKHKVNNL